MRALIFDAGPIISLTTNNMLGILPELKARFGGDFIIPEAVYRELVLKPFQTKKFKFEAFQVERLVEDGVLNVSKSEAVRRRGILLADLGNQCFSAQGQYLRIVHSGEMESLALCNKDNNTLVMDERITRQLIEEPQRLRKILEKRYHAPVKINKSSLVAFRKALYPLDIIRSVELVAVAFALGMMNRYTVAIPHAKRELLDSLLWGVKLHGCSVSEEEIKTMVKKLA